MKHSKYISLLSRNLSGNNLQVWNAHGSSSYLRSLVTVDVQGNMGRRPAEKYILELPRLREVRYVSRAAECMDCRLMKNLSERLIRLYSKSPLSFTNPDTCYTTSDFLALLARNRFLVTGCRNISECTYGKETNRTTTQPCWHINQRGISGLLLFGTLGGCLNFVVFLNILFTKT